MIGRPGGNVVVLSPHLDDAVLSVGAAIRTSSGRGSRVRVLTVLGGDPDSLTPASSWDQRAGFSTEGEAARTRRREDALACSLLGAEPIWLPFGDMTYGRRATDDEVWAKVASRLEGSDTVLVPGSPLSHPDHRWLAGLALERLDPAVRTGLYLEQPYALHLGEASRPEEVVVTGTSRAWAWTTVESGRSARRDKRRAVRAYASQLPLLSPKRSLPWRLSRAELRWGGEMIAWIGDGG